MSKRVHGSIRNKITAPELITERAKCNFDKDQMIDAFWNNDRKSFNQI